ncbi:hypothetical protein LMG28140_00837 [Paraburkholderia metrosideri]|uniref:Uncharacterized protein n=1 Tax=Paraburkholderia metrosideri TaxID=580937 RepID=A0ABM8NC66_9BURK|nr:hypothetical protein LMG28140_00837 [Paraburkholderia metrosideri]
MMFKSVVPTMLPGVAVVSLPATPVPVGNPTAS